MQFISNGPDVPNTLLQAHEDGQIVFFCGAGISYPAGLPDFKGLVDKIYRILGTAPLDDEINVLNNRQFDTTLHLLEKRHPGQRRAVREALCSALQPKLRRKGATDTHTALLQLSRCHRDGNLRLVTTNFDLVFEYAARKIKEKHNEYIAPMLPIPKDHHWNGLVYLHGRLPKTSNDNSALHNLVLSSGDFGNAYLIERWAARFVSELFHNYIICFVGYSIADPVLRYMMDALAADNLRGAVTRKAYAFASCEPGQENDMYKKWDAKSVIPILYEISSGTNDHSVLHQTLKAWAETYRDGITGKERIVAKYASIAPSASTAQDDFVGRMLWAISDKSGKPAKLFAKIDPVPPFEWLEAFSENCYKHEDLPLFGVSPHNKVDEKLCFSLLCRPSPYECAPKMSLICTGETHWDEVMGSLAQWLLRYLNDPKLLLWITRQGWQLHGRWLDMVRWQMNELACLESKDKTATLDEIHVSSPQAIPTRLMRTLWSLVLDGRVTPSRQWRDLGLHHWKERLRFEGLSASLRMNLRELLKPVLTLLEAFQWPGGKKHVNPPTKMRELVDCELVLACDDVQSLCNDLKNHSALPQLLDEFQNLLRDALDLLRAVDKANEGSDGSYLYMSSISPHAQNRGLYDWVLLIGLLRDSWLAVKSSDVEKSIRVAQDWFKLPYPTFKRLAFFAASYENVIESKEWVDWLLSNDAWWLWHPETKREVMRLLVLRGNQLTASAKERLEAGILAGPPREMFRSDLDFGNWQKLIAHSIWLRLSKLVSSGITLGAAARERLEELQIANREWQLAPDESDEFSIWSSSSLAPDYKWKITILPHKRAELVVWFRQFPDESLFDSNWTEVCRKHPLNSLYALYDLSKENIYPLHGWVQALYEWGKNHTLELLRHIAQVVLILSKDGFQKIVLGISQWLDAVSKVATLDDKDILLEMCQRILMLSPPESDPAEGRSVAPRDLVTEAINHHIGYTTEVIVKLLFKNKLNDNDGLPEDIKPLFTQLCNTSNKQFRPGRVVLALQLVPLFRIDKQWTAEHLLPLFDWSSCPEEAPFVWAGFLQSPRSFPSLLQALKTPFLNTSEHYESLDKHSRQSFVSFITYAAVEGIDGFTSDEFRIAFEHLPQEALEVSVKSLSQAPQGTGEQRANYWKNRIKQFWQAVWPKNQSNCSKKMAEYLAQVCIAVDSEFPDALKSMMDWLQPIEYPGYILTEVSQSGLCSRYPRDVLNLLSKVIDSSFPSHIRKELDSCLKAIAQADVTLEKDDCYKKLLG